ncbi:unnamed protein product [Caenorhabditis sp. 36 PRJEB53466]|nr:unnamed protein product [Caenorhabditis sp. 36 PRJEB53466]
MKSSSIFKPYQKYECWRGDTQKILKNSIGRQLPYIANFKKNVCQVFNIEWEIVTHSFTFPDGCTLIDVDYFPAKDGQFGICIGVEDQSLSWGAEHFVVALVADEDNPTMRMTHSVAVPVRITTLKTLFSSMDMAEGRENGTLGLHSSLLEWPHILAIGCKETKCFLAQLTESKAEPIATASRRHQINLLGGYTTDGTFQLTQEGDAYRDYPANAVYITAFALMPRSRTLMVGFSMGAILAASLNPSNIMVFLELRHERLIREIAPLEPEDDPDKFEYFIAAVDRSSRHPIMIQMWRGSFKTLEVVDDAEKYDKPSYHVVLEHKLQFGERWLSVNPIVCERGEYSNRRRDDSTMDSILNVSQSFGCTSNRSHVLLAYEKRQLSISASDEPVFLVEAAIFDVDAWYYKRVPGKITSDGTVLAQCAFMSCIKSEIPSENVSDVGILTLNSTDVTRFRSSVSDADPLFYPSSLSYDRVFVVRNNRIDWMKIQSIQQTILEKCASKLPFVIRSPELMAAEIFAAGLVRKSILTGSPNSSAAEINESELSTEQKIVLNAMVYHGKIEEFCNLATRHDLSDKIKKEIADWAVHEAVDYKRIVSDGTVSLFQGITKDLSPIVEDTVVQGIKLFRVVHEFLKVCSKNIKDGARLNTLVRSLKCMRNHTKLASRFIMFRLVPPNHQSEIQMRESHEKRKNLALKNKTALPIQLVIRNMHRLASDAQFWNDMPHDEWYPPTPLDLLESVLNVNISERIKRELIVQYVIDWTRVQPGHAEDTEKELAVETIKVMTNQMLDVDLEKIYYVLDQEKAALKQKQPLSLTNEEGGAKKVFTLQDDGLTYDQLWSGEVHLASTIGKNDLERFQQRMKMQVEGEKRRMPVLDPELEMLYQVYLFENQKYELMSAEAIESNKLLSSFMPVMMRKGGRQSHQKSAKEQEIQKSVREMFDKQLEKDRLEMPKAFVCFGDKQGKKRPSEAYEQDSTSPVQYVPPTAKRIQQVKRQQPCESPVVKDVTQASSVASPSDLERNAEINMMIATPARYYKRPIPASAAVDLTSPTTNRLPPVPTQNSILKTAKTIQSPSRGRIRFHESVHRGANESIESTEEIMEEDEEAPRLKGLNFAILEDEEEEEMTTTRRSVVHPIEEQEEKSGNEEEEDGIEMEKSYEAQDDFEVLEDRSEETIPPAEPMEDTFVIRTDDISPGVDETYELTEREEMPEKTTESVEMVQEEGEKLEEEEFLETAEVQNERETVAQVATTEEKEKEEDEEIGDVLGEELHKEEEKDSWHEPLDGIHRSFEMQKDEDCVPVATHRNEEEEESIEELAEDIPLDRTFEVEEEEDPQPLADLPKIVRPVIDAPATPELPAESTPDQAEPEQEQATPVQANAERDEAEHAEAEHAEPKRADQEKSGPEKAETEQAEQEQDVPEAVAEKTEKPQENVKKVEKPAEVDPFERPPSANTRSATKSARNSRSVSPTEEPISQKKEQPKSTTRKASAASVQKTTEVQEDEEEDDRPPSRRTRAASVRKETTQGLPEQEEVKKTPRKRATSVRKDTGLATTEEPVEEQTANTSKATRASSVKRTSSRSRTTSAALPQDEQPMTSSVRTTRSRTTSRNVTPAREVEKVKQATRKSPARRKTEDRSATPAEEAPVFPDLSGSALVRQISANRKTISRTTSVNEITPATSAARSAPRAQSVLPTATPRRGRPPKIATESNATPAVAGRAASKRRTPSADDSLQEEPPKKARGRPRNTPLKVIPESSDQPATSAAEKTTETPRRTGSRSRSNSTSSNANMTMTPKRGRKASLEDLAEEDEDTDTAPLRRSARRLPKP